MVILLTSLKESVLPASLYVPMLKVLKIKLSCAFAAVKRKVRNNKMFFHIWCFLVFKFKKIPEEMFNRNFTVFS